MKRKNIQKDKKYVDQMQENTRRKHMQFNRYLMIRYFLAIFMFANFYLFVCTSTITKVIPAGLFVIGMGSCMELIKLYGNKNTQMHWTKRFFQVQLLVNSVCIVCIATPLFQVLFPFLVDVMMTRIAMICICLVGAMMAYACLYRFKQIDTNSDKQYMYIKQYEKTVKI